ncbi:MAG: iron-sulfur cluster assembly accessory protein [Chitinophagales bacterium]|nr:iron-sulfur cluster assembly accessory protein [Chitinophagales bacterium]MDW8393116.1 iron-sulfur cluster assembly accessory protein [Chitinophagales bacterium]
MSANAPTTEVPLHLTAGALSEIRRLMQEQAGTGKEYLRVGVKGGGCSGLTYVLEFDQRQPDDLLFIMDEVPVVVQPMHLLYLHGMTIDYETGLNARGFVFINPNAKSTCGCGTSFST